MTVLERKQRLRRHSEHVLRLAAMDEIGRRYPGKVTKSALPKENAFWRFVFVPLYRRVPWSFKQNAMRRLRLTAQGWPDQPRMFGTPWRPPAGTPPPTAARGRDAPPGDAER
jgi:hypothetical protein